MLLARPGRRPLHRGDLISGARAPAPFERALAAPRRRARLRATASSRSAHALRNRAAAQPRARDPRVRARDLQTLDDAASQYSTKAEPPPGSRMLSWEVYASLPGVDTLYTGVAKRTPSGGIARERARPVKPQTTNAIHPCSPRRRRVVVPAEVAARDERDEEAAGVGRRGVAGGDRHQRGGVEAGRRRARRGRRRRPRPTRCGSTSAWRRRPRGRRP